MLGVFGEGLHQVLGRAGLAHRLAELGLQFDKGDGVVQRMHGQHRHGDAACGIGVLAKGLHGLRVGSVTLHSGTGHLRARRPHGGGL